jgi:hypothetical protein
LAEAPWSVLVERGCNPADRLEAWRGPPQTRSRHDRRLLLPLAGSTTGSGKTEQDVRTQLPPLLARYDTGAIPPAVFSIIRSLQVELSWNEHRGPR